MHTVSVASGGQFPASDINLYESCLDLTKKHQKQKFMLLSLITMYVICTNTLLCSDAPINQ